MNCIIRLCVFLGALSAAVTALAASPDELARGEYLARAGDCVVCHTGPNERPFSGGLKMGTPLGTITTTNITPDRETGIGLYSFADFERAMRHGVARDGHQLYPAMPYPSYAKVSEDDLRALYAFFMESVPAVHRDNEPSAIPSPYNIRWPLAIWNLLFTDSVGYKPDPTRDAQWNRGAYLVEGLGHCGSCHTQRGTFFQEKGLSAPSQDYLAGGNLDFWSAVNLRSDSLSGLGRWSEGDIAAFLKDGHNAHSTAFGTMIDVVNNSTQYLSNEDLAAVAHYLQSLSAVRDPAGASYGYDPKSTEALRNGVFDAPGARIYFQQCSGCHLVDGKGHSPFLPPLAGNPATLDSDPASIINVTLNGSAKIVVQGMPDAYRMPQFRAMLNDQQIADVVGFIRQSWGNHAPPVTTDQVAQIRKSSDPATDAVVILKMR